MSSDNIRPKTKRRLRELAPYADANFRLARELLAAALARAEAGERVPLHEALRAARILDAAAETLVQIRDALNAETSERGQDWCADEIDLERERARIRRLLDRLRAAHASD